MLEMFIFFVIILAVSFFSFLDGHRRGYESGVEDGKDSMADTLDHYEARIYELTQGPGTAQRVRGA